MNNLIILWLDDQRDPYRYLNTKSTSATFARNKQFYDNLLKQYNANFVWVKNLYQFIDYIEKNGIPQFVSFDHDLNNRGGGEGLSDEQKLSNNGVNCAKWLVNYCKQMGQPLPKFYVHSANPKHGPEINKVLTSENKKMKKIIRLTESDLHRIVKESVKRILKEEQYGLDDWNHGMMASQNSVDLGYEYEGELWGSDGSHAYLVTDENGNYNVEDEDENLVFNNWFSDVNYENGNDDVLIGVINGTRVALNWVTRQIKPIG